MDFGQIKQLLATVQWTDGTLQASGGTVTKFGHFKRFVNTLSAVPTLAPLAKDLRTHPLFAQAGASFSTDPKTIGQFKEKADVFYQSAMGLRDLLAEDVLNIAPETIVVTIPQGKDLSSVNESLDQVRKALAQLVSEEAINGKLEVQAWKNGSLLVYIFVGTLSAIAIIARTLKAAAIAYQEIQRGRATAQHVALLKEHVRESKIKNSLSEAVAEAQTKLIKATVEREALATELDIFPSSNHERLERIKNSVRILADLFGKGTTVSPALEMPEEERAKFPDVAHLLATVPPIKQIPDSDTPGDVPAPATNAESE